MPELKDLKVYVKMYSDLHEFCKVSCNVTYCRFNDYKHNTCKLKQIEIHADDDGRCLNFEKMK